MDIGAGAGAYQAGALNVAWRARVDALRHRIAGRGRIAEDSVAVLREERERRSEELFAAPRAKSTRKQGRRMA